MTVLAFAGEDFYPQGGWGDYLGAYPTAAHARRAVEEGIVRHWSNAPPSVRHHDWAHLVQDGRIIATYVACPDSIPPTAEWTMPEPTRNDTSYDPAVLGL